MHVGFRQMGKGVLWVTPWLFLLIFPITGLAYDVVAHRFQITLSPQESRIEVKDTVELPKQWQGKTIQFILHGDLAIDSASEAVIAVPLSGPYKTASKDYEVPVKQYRLELEPGQNHFEIHYHGRINHPVARAGEEYDRSTSETPGLIDPQGVFLANSTVWYPLMDSTLVTFSMQVSVPKHWSVVTQGRRTAFKRRTQSNDINWQVSNPQDDIYVVANRFVEYSQQAGKVQAMVFLREKDDALAQKYLDATDQYLNMYSRLLGPYPYSKFALVENFWDTGYGMPSFTLLGPKVIRFPFILHSSYPHEILHNWWGNGVFVDYESGNWAEGLTAYLADHLIKEQRGEGAEYRRSVLQKYTDYVTTERDFALTEFRSRHNASTEAVGYGKAMMFFHMLRLQLGDDEFVHALREFYRQEKFKLATYGDVQRIFEKTTGKSLAKEFLQWVRQVGAPNIQLNTVTNNFANGIYHVTLELEQRQTGDSYNLNIPVAVHVQGAAQAFQTSLQMTGKKQIFDIEVPGKPLRVDVDPEFDVFRRLSAREIPSALSQGFGAQKILVLIPSSAPEARKKAYLNLAKSWQKTQEGQWQIKSDDEIPALPTDRTVWLLGWENKFRAALDAQLLAQNAKIETNEVRLGDELFTRQSHSILLTARHPDNETQTLLWLATDNTAAIPGLIGKLPHYRKYSYLAFQGDEPINIAKGQWQVTDSPMTRLIKDGKDQPPPAIKSTLKKRQALAQLPPVFSKDHMMQDIEYLASEKLAGRGLGSKELDQAADYIAQVFKQAGLEPGGDQGRSYFQRWQQDFGGDIGSLPLRNVVGVLPGTDPIYAKESVIVSAHYDHLGRGWPDVHKGDEGKIHYGADDNASGIAVMLELARKAAKDWKPKRSIIFIAFTGEEAQRAGSKFYVKQSIRYPVKNVMGVINLDTVGRLGKSPLTVFGVGSAKEWIHIFRGIGYVTGVNINSVSNDYGFSDQQSFIDAGVPGVQLFGTVHQDYHRPEDTVDKIDGDGLLKVAAVLKEAVEYLADREEPLTTTIGNAAPAVANDAKSVSTPPATGRKVSLGTVPDYEYKGEGVLISGTEPGSPAQKAGLQKGDIIVFMKGTDIGNLKDFARVLRGMKPGEKATVKYKRNGVIVSVDVVVDAR